MIEAPIRNLFVYGTLMRGWSNRYAQLLHAKAEFLGEASAAGRLYDLGRFPGATFDSDDRSRVWGEVFRLDAVALLDELDAYEACRPQDPEPHLFRRRVVEVKAGQVSMRAFAYELTDAAKARTAIPSGRFALAH